MKLRSIVRRAAAVLGLLAFGAGTAHAQTLLATIPVQSMSYGGPYAGPISSPFSGIALYSNGDHCNSTYTFPGAGEYEIEVSGASSNSTSAGAALEVGGVQQSVMWFTGTAPTNQTAYVYVRSAGSVSLELLETTDNGSNDTYIQSLSIYSVSGAASPTTPSTGSYTSGTYQNLFGQLGIPSSAVNAQITAAWNSLFYGNASTNAVYFPAGDNNAGLAMSYIEDIEYGDVRSEGMSYGMMIAVQLNHQAAFNALYTWAKTYELNTSGAFQGYFGWDNQTSGAAIDNKPAPDGDQWYATDLLLASGRWGNSGEYNYQAEAFAILSNMINHPWGSNVVPGSSGPMFSATPYASSPVAGNSSYLVCFQPFASNFAYTDPSYVLPAFYSLWAKCDTQGSDAAFWADAATYGRDFLHIACNADTGLTSDYENFNGSSYGGTNWSYDSWRVAANIGVDNSWWAADQSWQTSEEALQESFFEDQGLATYVNQYSTTGSPIGSALPGPGLIGMNASGALASSNVEKWDFVNALLDTSIPTGEYRYYDGMLYMLALLECSGNFQIYLPGQTVTTPAAPTGLSASAGNAQVSLTWSASAGASSYSIYRGTTSGGESSTPVATGVTATSYTNTGLTNGTTYYYKVAAVNSAGTSALSAEASATPKGVAPPTPSGLTATAGNAQVSLAWSASAGATSYNVYRSATSGGEGSTAYATGVSGTSYINTGLTNGTTYYYTVAAVNAYGTSAQSSEVSATPTAPTLSAPTGLTATAGNAQVALSWTGVSGATSYNVYRGTTSGGESSNPVATGITSTSYTNTGLTNGTTYYYKVAAVGSGGTSPESSEASATPAAGSSGGPIANGTYQLTPQSATGSRLDAAGSGTGNGTGVQIWTASGGANQEWVFTNVGNGYYTISPSYDANLCLAVSGNGTTDGTVVELWSPNGGTSQQWSLTAVSGGYEITPALATGERLHVVGSGSANGTGVEIYHYISGDPGQIWAIH